jgi:hypothetical protein
MSLQYLRKSLAGKTLSWGWSHQSYSQSKAHTFSNAIHPLRQSAGSKVSQRIYCCVLVHDRTTGTLISSHKEDLLKKIEHQLSLGQEGLAVEDQFLLECNFDELTSTSGKHQEYWTLAIQAA